MENTIYNVYVPMESQSQCYRMKQLCLDNGLPIWEHPSAFNFNDEYDVFALAYDTNEFFILAYKSDCPNYKEVTESEFIKLLKNR